MTSLLSLTYWDKMKTKYKICHNICTDHIKMCRSVFPVEDVLTYFHLENQQNMSFDQGYSNYGIQ